MFDPKSGGWVPEQIKNKNKKQSLKESIKKLENQLLKQQANNEKLSIEFTKNILNRLKKDYEKIKDE
jgi:hypothetical protein